MSTVSTSLNSICSQSWCHFSYARHHLGLRACKPLVDVTPMIKYKLEEITYCRLSTPHYHLNNILMAIRMTVSFPSNVLYMLFLLLIFHFIRARMISRNNLKRVNICQQKSTTISMWQSVKQFLSTLNSAIKKCLTNITYSTLQFYTPRTVKSFAEEWSLINAYQGCGFITDHQDMLDSAKPDHKVRILRGASVIGSNHKLLGIIGPRYNCTACNIFEVISLHRWYLQWYLMAQNDLQEFGSQSQLCSDRSKTKTSNGWTVICVYHVLFL